MPRTTKTPEEIQQDNDRVTRDSMEMMEELLATTSRTNLLLEELKEVFIDVASMLEEALERDQEEDQG